MRTLFLEALQGKEISTTPLWMMRQAGRYLPEYRKVRRHFSDFMQMCKTPEACCQVALQPLDRFDLDAGIVFSDILTVPEAMRLPLRFVEGQGPVFDSPVKNITDIKKLDAINSIERLNYVMEAVSLTKQTLSNRLPLIGFCGSPWTIAAYMVEGKTSKQFNKLRKMMYSAPSVLHSLLIKLTTVTEEYLLAQIKAGADAIMIFDTWGGLLSAENYPLFSLNYMKKIIQAIKALYANIPVILFTKGGGLWLDKILQSGADGIGIDWTISIENARNIVKDKVTLQGNLDPAALYGDDKSIRLAVKNMLSAEANNSRYVYNLGHGIYPDIDPDKVQVMVDAVREFGQKMR